MRRKPCLAAQAPAIAAAVGMALIDLDCTAVEGNTAVAQMLGYTKRELFGGTVRDVMHPDDFEAHRLLFKRLVEGELPYGDSDRRLICKNGVIINTQIWSTIQRDEHGKPLYMVAMVRDVSAQVRAQKEKDQLQSQQTGSGKDITETKHGFLEDISLCIACGTTHQPGFLHTWRCFLRCR